jgi:exonuclease VII small subunit
MAQVELTKTEAWRILDAIQVYKKDYELTEYAKRTIRNAEKKLKKVVNE